jgi:peptide-methionine (S)-S-oxide reductase
VTVTPDDGGAKIYLYGWEESMKSNLTILLLFACGLATAVPVSGGEPVAGTARATFAGGCFWCMEPPFDVLEGVISTTSGYAGGRVKNPSYQEVSAGGTGHAEVVQVEYDPSVVSYQELLEVFWRNIDPTAKDRQFCDRGSQYRSAIFYHDEAQRAAAEQSRAELERTKPFQDPIVTEILALKAFYPAEDYHQDYYEKNPLKYKYYRYGCGRDKRLEELWGSSK